MTKISKGLLLIILCFHVSTVYCQTPVTYNSADIYQQLKKLNVLGSILYIAAHPDDENNGLLPYFAKEKLYRTGYLSLTRGDGGQNLIGSEQGYELGMIRTQELLAARRIDGAEQFFSRAYEFGFSKSSEEALKFWGRDKILSDVVWVIRQYQPDVIIKRFPPDKRAGHGHHAASAILADEAFTAAADPNRFPEQLKYGVKPWQAKRILWNTFNFGGNNTTSEDQLKVEVGGYNPLIGKSYGELGGEARSMHKSQGEGRPRRRGPVTEYFTTTAGDAPKTDLMDGIMIDWKRIPGGENVGSLVNQAITDFKLENPALSVPALVRIYTAIKALPETNWRNKKLSETQTLIEACAGLFAEATTNEQNIVQGDRLAVTFFVNSRGAVNATVKNINFETFDTTFSSPLASNQTLSVNKIFRVSADKKITQPYWLEYPQSEGAFDVRDQMLIGKAENDPAFEATFTINIAQTDFTIRRPVQYKVVDPAKGELYQPVAVLPKVEFNYARENYVSLNGNPVAAPIHFKTNFHDTTHYIINQKYSEAWANNFPSVSYNAANSENAISSTFTSKSKETNTTEAISLSTIDGKYSGYTKTISYDHIPTLTYFPEAKANLLKVDVKTVGKKVGYIVGAGDKVPEALTALGYNVSYLDEAGVNDESLKQFDAIIVGIRAYNIFEYLSNKNDVFNRYVENGGNMIVQYMKSMQVGLKRIQTGPYPFTVTGTRVTEENAKVSFLLPKHPVFNYPNKITQKDFEGWIQERSTYQVDQSDEHYEKLISMNDVGEKESNGSLAIAKYGKGNYAYVGLVLFRQLPGGVPGAYRLMANLIALPKNK
ncbi:PIG-L family deacetylase [Segetibacter sp.]|jgi:LmbE family N-acetylglucosaminyl deacetylase|uniref:PIG-L family deacetylase n=1 Tax=Segetibacter sp. TaxID=2231182 RepID=UPI0026377A61|nr:PIG-L family deacetylase [Segetibacter sp.]MCW3079373.1 family deacetylase [Segetibacter sp.]